MLLRRTLLALAVLTTAATAVVIGFAANLLVQGYSGSNDPQSVSALAIPLAFIILGAAGLPLTLASAGAWAGYLTAARKHRQLPR